jgi:ribosomal protein L28
MTVLGRPFAAQSLGFLLSRTPTATRTSTNICTTTTNCRLFASARSSHYNRPSRGLYASKSLSHGSSLSPHGNATRRQWLPNTQYCRLYSEALGERVRVRCSTGAMREIDRAGGVDAYVLGMGREELQGDAFQGPTFATKLKNRILTALLQKESMKESCT